MYQAQWVVESYALLLAALLALGIGAGSLTALFFVERRHASPMLPLALLRNRDSPPPTC